METEDTTTPCTRPREKTTGKNSKSINERQLISTFLLDSWRSEKRRQNDSFIHSSLTFRFKYFSPLASLSRHTIVSQSPRCYVVEIVEGEVPEEDLWLSGDSSIIIERLKSDNNLVFRDVDHPLGELTNDKIYAVYMSLMGVGYPWEELNNMLKKRYKEERHEAHAKFLWKCLYEAHLMHIQYSEAEDEYDEINQERLREIINDAILWVIAADYRWDFPACESVLQSLNAPVLTLLWHDFVYKVHIRSSDN